MKLREFYDDTFRPAWLASANKATLAGYTATVDMFAAWCEGATLDDLSEEKLDDFREWLVTTGRALPQYYSHARTPTARDCISRLRQVRQFAKMQKQSAPQDMYVMQFFTDVAMKERTYAHESVKKIRSAVRLTSKDWGSDLLLSELDRTFIDGIERRRREYILALWRFAFELGYVNKGPDSATTDQPEPSLVNGGDSLRALMTNKYFPAKWSIKSDQTKKQYRFAINALAKHVGREPTLADLSDDTLVGLMRALEAEGLSPKTINERAGRIKALWKWLASRGYLRLFPTTDRISETVRTPRAWTDEELRRLFDALSNTPGNVGAIRACHWWLAMVATLWNTGERVGAVMAVEWSHLQDDVLTIPAEIRKGGRKDAVFRLWPETLDLLQRIDEPKRDLIFPFPYHLSTLHNRYKAILKRAGLPTTRYDGLHKMRRSHASWLHAGGGDATASLGHDNRSTTDRSYLDPAIGLKPVKLFKPWTDAG